jgi:uncharacterized protein
MKTRLKTMMPWALVALTLSAIPATAQPGPSFDCSRAANAVETAICQDGELSRLDRALTIGYSTALEQVASSDDWVMGMQDNWISTRIIWLEEMQRQWIADRNACETNDCIKKAYGKQIVFLGEQQ